jgi:DNA-binding FrmR family transcriptional regulator
MTHTIREKTKLLARVRRIRGQVEAIERALDTEARCEQVMHLIAGARGAMAGLMAEVVEDHVRTHLVDVNRRRTLPLDRRPRLTPFWRRVERVALAPAELVWVAQPGRVQLG